MKATTATASAWNAEHGRAVIREHKDKPGALLPVLHAVQETFGYVPPEAVRTIADELNLSRADVHGVVTFYHFFRQHPPGRTAVQICRAEACQSMRGEELAEYAVRRTGAEFHGVSADGRYSLDAVYCLGNCACAPSATIDGQVYGRLSPQRLDELLSSLEEHAE